MDLTFDEGQEIFRKTAQKFLKDECPPTLVRELETTELGYSPQTWEKMAQLGWIGLPFPEQYGGGDGSLVDLAILHEEMGRAMLPSPYAPTVDLCGLAILAAGSEDQKQAILPAVARGEKLLSPAILEPACTDYDPANMEVTASPAGEDYVINGTKVFVKDAHVAAAFLCAARSGGSSKAGEGITLFLVDARSPGLGRQLTPDIAGQKLHELTFSNVRVPMKDIVGELHHGWEPLSRALEQATVLQCAEIIGTCEKVLEISLDWAKRRVQFEKPIGFFQAVQHKVVNMRVKIEETRALTYAAAARISQGLPSRLEVSEAKAFASATAQYVAYEGHQVFAGIGFMQVHDMQLYSRRLKAAELNLGDADFHRKRVVEALAGA